MQTGPLNVGTAATISANGNATFSGIVTASSFSGDGTGLTGVASTDNIQTGTPANFLNSVNITGLTTVSNQINFGTAGTAATVYTNGNATFSGIVTAASYVGNFTGNVTGDVTGDLTGNADTFTVTANNSTDETVYPIFVDGATGAQGAESDTGLTYNPSTGNVTAGAFTVGTAATVYANGNITAGIVTATEFVVGAAVTIGRTDGNATFAGIVTATSFVGDGSGLTDVPGGASEEDTAVSSTSATSVYSVAHADYRSASIIIQITQGSAYQVGRYLVIHDGTTASILEESAVATGSMLGTFTTGIDGANLKVYVNMGSASSATVTVLATALTV